MVFCNTGLLGKEMDARFRNNSNQNDVQLYNFIDSNPKCDHIEFGDNCGGNGENKVCVLAQTF